MFFKSMEIYGFKSFPDKTILTFDKKMTAVVGSNGNGKSNISDAIVIILVYTFGSGNSSLANTVLFTDGIWLNK